MTETSTAKIDGYGYWNSTIPQPIQCNWKPRPDITIHELALLLPYLVRGIPLYEEGLAELGTAARHIERIA